MLKTMRVFEENLELYNSTLSRLMNSMKNSTFYISHYPMDVRPQVYLPFYRSTKFRIFDIFKKNTK